MSANRKPNAVHSKADHFRVDGKDIEYVLYTGEIDVSSVPVWGNVGDLYQSGGSLWYRDEEEWVGGVIDHTQHPVHDNLVISLSRNRGKWIHRGTLKSRATKSRGIKRQRSDSAVHTEEDVQSKWYTSSDILRVI